MSTSDHCPYVDTHTHTCTQTHVCTCTWASTSAHTDVQTRKASIGSQFMSVEWLDRWLVVWVDNKTIIPKYVSMLNYANEVIVLELSIALALPQPCSRALTFLVVTVYASASSWLFRALCVLCLLAQHGPAQTRAQATFSRAFSCYSVSPPGACTHHGSRDTIIPRLNFPLARRDLGIKVRFNLILG